MGPALLLVLYGEIDVTVQPALGSVFPGPWGPHRLFVLGAGLLTASRRRYPLAVQLAVNIVNGLWILLLYPATQQPPLERSC